MTCSSTDSLFICLWFALIFLRNLCIAWCNEVHVMNDIWEYLLSTMSPRITVYTTTMSAAAPEKYNTLVRPQVNNIFNAHICMFYQFLIIIIIISKWWHVTENTRPSLILSNLFQGLPTKLTKHRADNNNAQMIAAECPFSVSDHHSHMQICNHVEMNQWVWKGNWANF